MPILPARALRTIPSFAITLALAGALAGCGGGKQMPDKGPVEVGYITVRTEPVTLTTELPGRTSSVMISEVRPQVEGIVEKRLFTEGSLVHAGQPLYQIDPRRYQATRDSASASLQSAEASLAAAQAKARRYQSLTDSDAVSRQDRDDVLASARSARAAVNLAKANVRTAGINLAFTRVYAPITGRIGRSSVTPGALVTSSQTTALATITQLDPIFVDVTQSSSKLLQLRRALASGKALPASATIHLKLEDGSDYPLTGKIEFAEPIVDENSGMVTIRARFPNPDGLLLPGMFVRVVAPQSTVPGAILAPQQGISRDAKGDATALVVTRDNKVEQRVVVAAQAIGDKWLITKGLKAGDRLIVEGSGKIAPGDKVKPVAVAASR